MRTEKNNNENMSQSWHDKLRKRMETHSELPPDGLWEGIEQGITNEVQRKKRMLWYKRTAQIAAVLLVAIIGGRYAFNHREGEPIIVKQNTTIRKTDSPQTNDNLPTEIIPTDEISTTEETLLTDENRSEIKHKYPSHKTQIAEKHTQEKETHKAIFSERNIDFEASTEIFNKIDSVAIAQNEADKNTENLDDLLAQEEEITDEKTTRSWQTNVFVSHFPSKTNQQQHGFSHLMAYDSPVMNDDFEHAQASPGLYREILVQNTNQEINTLTKHSQPVTAGMSLQYHLGKRWHISSGFTYSYLYSELYSGTDDYHYENEQSLHYIGVPANVSYSLWKKQRFNAYLSSGILMEKNVAGRLVTSYGIRDEEISVTRENIRVTPLQWSANAALGVEYRLHNHFGLYAEPGFSYYFKNKTDIETIYKEKPVNFTLRVGLRIFFK